MPKVSIRTPAQAKPSPLPAGLAGQGRASTYFAGERDPLHLHLIELGGRERLRLEEADTDKLFYVWRGSVLAGEQKLAAGSSIIVEHGRHLDITADEEAALLAFGAAHPSRHALPGGHVHLLPAERAPRSDSLGGSTGVGGVLHADSSCPTCTIWLHENRFPGSHGTRQDAEAGIHSHSEDEIIFVLAGDVRLGARLYGPGTALAIAADTLYSFTAGPNGLHFANFRAAKPGDIRFANGRSMSEPAYWREQLPRPDYLSPVV